MTDDSRNNRPYIMGFDEDEGTYVIHDTRSHHIVASCRDKEKVCEYLTKITNERFDGSCGRNLQPLLDKNGDDIVNYKGDFCGRYAEMMRDKEKFLFEYRGYCFEFKEDICPNGCRLCGIPDEIRHTTREITGEIRIIEIKHPSEAKPKLDWEIDRKMMRPVI